MDVNERIARALGWEPCNRAGNRGHWHRERKGDDFDVCWSSECVPVLPDYAHSLDACLPVLADLREQGWQLDLTMQERAWVAEMWQYEDEHCRQQCCATNIFTHSAPSPAAALAECLADALETEKSPD